MRIYAYLRVSGKGQLKGDGFPRQLAAITKYCKAEGHELVKVYEEKAVPGATDMSDRPAWRQMIADALEDELGDIAICIEVLNRLARDLIVQEHIVADVQKRGLMLFSTAEPDLCSTDPTRVLIRQILGAVSAYDKSMIVLKLRGARERMKDKAGRCEGAKPYGELEGETATLERMRELAAAGATLTAIAAALNVELRRPRRGAQWYPMTVGRILGR